MPKDLRVTKDLEVVGIDAWSTEEKTDDGAIRTPAFAINWSGAIGFGQLIFRQSADGTITVETESMSDLFVKAVLAALLRKAKRVS